MKKLPLDAFYLGTPVFSSRSKTKDFKYLIDRTEARLKGWRSKCLSWAGRRTMINSVALSLPTYSFSTASVPTTMCNKLDSIIRRFWWNPKKEQGKFLAWKNWEALCSPIDLGGLGFRYSKQNNQALLAKFVWLILSKENSLCVNAFRSKYKIGSDWMKREALKFASPLWKTIEGLRSLISKGACYLIGDGVFVDFWKDPWIPWQEGFSPTPKDPSAILENIKVANFILPSTNSWNRVVLVEIVDAASLGAILKVTIPIQPRLDKLIWTLEPLGNFSMKSVIKSNASPRVQTPQDPEWHGLWKLKLHERLKIFLWRLGSNALLTKVNLAHRIGIGDQKCPLCGEAEETYQHLFLQCSVVKPIWFGLCWGIRSEHIPVRTNSDFVNLVVKPSLCQNHSIDTPIVSAQTSIHVALILECIWNLRNQVMHNNSTVHIEVVVSNLESKILEHLQTFKPLVSPAVVPGPL